MSNVRWQGIAVGSLFILVVLASAVPAQAEEPLCETAWGYEGNRGPTFWGQLDSEWGLCDSGKGQSPIVLEALERASLPEIQLRYPATLPYTLQHTAHELKVYPLLDAKISYGGNPAELLQFHVHTPAEHRLPDGPEAPAEIHFVHRQANGKLLVLGVLVVEGAANEQLQKLIDARPPNVCQSNKPAETLALSALLPSPNHHASYAGSLTTPPCSEEVTWIVLLEPIEATPEQIAALKVSANARGAQPRAGRKVRWRS